MYTNTVFKDFETPDRVDASGFYQIIEIRDFNDDEITSNFDQSRFYTGEDLKKKYCPNFQSKSYSF